MNCLACKKPVNIAERVNCCSCKGAYHNKCLGITKALYLKNPQKYDVNWQCPECLNVTRRQKNDLTPARSLYLDTINSDLEESIIGDTLVENTDSTEKEENISLPNFQQLYNLLDKKLESMQEKIIQKISASLEEKIAIQIKKLEDNFIQKYNKIDNDQKNIINNVSEIEKKIQRLQEKNDQLKQNLLQIQNTLDKYPFKHENKMNNEEKSKMFVLYGLNEPYQEDEHMLMDQLQNLVHEFYGVNLSGYIETATRIGKKGMNRRPVVVELISKRVTNYILENTPYLKNTGLSITEYLDEERRRIRKQLQDIMKNARKEGNHALIKNNKLIINGVEQKLQSGQKNKENKETNQEQNNHHNNNTFRH